MADVKVPSDFAEKMAASLGRRLAEAAARELKETAQRNAPDAKVWVSLRDGAVRPSHVTADGQTIPENIDYGVPALEYVRRGRDEHGKAVNQAGGYREVPAAWEPAARPRDPRLSQANRVNCRCESVPLPGVVAGAISTGEVVVSGAQAQVHVTCRFKGAPESEKAQQGGGWMRAGVTAAADFLRRQDSVR